MNEKDFTCSSMQKGQRLTGRLPGRKSRENFKYVGRVTEKDLSLHMDNNCQISTSEMDR